MYKITSNRVLVANRSRHIYTKKGSNKQYIRLHGKYLVYDDKFKAKGGAESKGTDGTDDDVKSIYRSLLFIMMYSISLARVDLETTSNNTVKNTKYLMMYNNILMKEIDTIVVSKDYIDDKDIRENQKLIFLFNYIQRVRDKLFKSLVYISDEHSDNNFYIETLKTFLTLLALLIMDILVKDLNISKRYPDDLGPRCNKIISSYNLVVSGNEHVNGMVFGDANIQTIMKNLTDDIPTTSLLKTDNYTKIKALLEIIQHNLLPENIDKSLVHDRTDKVSFEKTSESVKKIRSHTSVAVLPPLKSNAPVQPTGTIQLSITKKSKDQGSQHIDNDDDDDDDYFEEFLNDIYIDNMISKISMIYIAFLFNNNNFHCCYDIKREKGSEDFNKFMLSVATRGQYEEIKLDNFSCYIDDSSLIKRYIPFKKYQYILYAASF